MDRLFLFSAINTCICYEIRGVDNFLKFHLTIYELHFHAYRRSYNKRYPSTAISRLTPVTLSKMVVKLATKRVCQTARQAAIAVTSIPLTFIGLCGLDGRQHGKAATHIVLEFTLPILRTRFTSPVI